MLGITDVLDNLCISGLESRATILNKGIRCVINISSECPTQDLGPTIEYEKVNILDLPTTSIHPHFDRLTDRIHKNIQQGKKTLVHCYVGRSRSATIILAYLMKHQQMSLRDAFQYLRSRRPIVGPNFGFIKQLIAYEKLLHGFTSVSFVNTPFGSVPDIYLSMPTTRSLRQTTTSIPIQTTSSMNNTIGKSSLISNSKPVNNTTASSRSAFLFSTPPRPGSLIHRSTNTLPTRASTTFSNYTSAYNQGATAANVNPRPVSSTSVYYRSNTTPLSNIHRSSFIHQPSEQPMRIGSSSPKPYGQNSTTRELFIPTKINTFRTVKYVPSSYNRYRLP